MAKRFRFRLETLLRVRRQREDEHKRIVAARLREIRTLQDRRRFLREEVDRQNGAMRHALAEPLMDIDRCKRGRHWVLLLRRGVLEADAQIASHRAILAQERVSLAESRKETKVLERLKERQRGAFLAEVNRREQIELDEMNASRFAHAIIAKDSVKP